MINEILSTGIENARTAKDICRILNIKRRDLTQAIERERRQGSPICATTGKQKGYFLAASQKEMQIYCNSLLHRVEEINKTRNACIETIKDLPI